MLHNEVKKVINHPRLGVYCWVYTPIRDDLKNSLMSGYWDDLLLGLPPGLKPLCAPACIAVARSLGLGHRWPYVWRMSGGRKSMEETTNYRFGLWDTLGTCHGHWDFIGFNKRLEFNIYEDPAVRLVAIFFGLQHGSTKMTGASCVPTEKYFFLMTLLFGTFFSMTWSFIEFWVPAG